MLGLLGGISGGAGGLSASGGSAGPSRSGNARSGVGNVGGLQFNTGARTQAAGYTMPLIVVVAGLIAYAFITR